jgi:organic radical activating enzyme
MREDPIKWRNAHLNSISPSFCAAKWYNASIHLGHGYTGSCHLPLPHPIPLEELKNNPGALHNTAHKKKMRRMMLTGVRPAECSYCWKIEDIGRNNVSDRVYKSTIYSDADISKLKNAKWDDNVLLKTVEVSFDRTCNFACSYCNASYSTTWAKDIKSQGPYQHFVSDGGGAYQSDGSWAEPYGKFSDNNPYVNAFMDWWPELSVGLEEMRVTGGEPTMSHNFWKFTEVMKQTSAPNMRFAVNSNLGMDKETLDRLVTLTKDLSIKDFDLYTSNESYGDHANYIRDKLDYDLWRDNLTYFIENAEFRAVTIMMTINSLCLFSITEFLDDIMIFKEKYGWHRPHIDLNILRWPSFMSPLALPDDIKKGLHTKLSTWYETNKESKLFTTGERDQIKRLLDYIEVVDKGHVYTTDDKSSLHHDFKSFYSQYDQRRGKSILTTFPEIADWYNSIVVNKSIPIAPLVDGKISHYEDGVYVSQR